MFRLSARLALYVKPTAYRLRNRYKKEGFLTPLSPGSHVIPIPFCYLKESIGREQ